MALQAMKAITVFGVLLSAVAPSAAESLATLRFDEQETCQVRDVCTLHLDGESRTHHLRFDVSRR
jgi:hypothetical protein